MATSGKSETKPSGSTANTGNVPPAIDTSPSMPNATMMNALLHQQQQQNASPMYGANNQAGFSMPPSGQIDPQVLNSLFARQMMWNGSKYFSPTGSTGTNASTSPPSVSTATTPMAEASQHGKASPQSKPIQTSTSSSDNTSPSNQGNPQTGNNNNLQGIANIMLNPSYQYQQVHPMPTILGMHPNVMMQQHQLSNQKRQRTDSSSTPQQSSFSPTQHLMNQLHQQQQQAGMQRTGQQQFDPSMLMNNSQSAKIHKMEGAQSQSPRGAHMMQSGMASNATTVKAPTRKYETGVISDCPPAHLREKGKVYVVRGHLKKWDGRRFARCCGMQGCTKLAQGPTNFCKGHGGGTRCKFTGCKKAARGGSDCCAVHGGGKRCKQPNCSKAAVGNDFCRRHGGGRRCTKAGCNATARGPSMLCPQHGGTPIPAKSGAMSQAKSVMAPRALKSERDDVRRSSVASLNEKSDAITSLLSMGKSVVHRQSDVPQALPVPVTKAPSDVNPVVTGEEQKVAMKEGNGNNSPTNQIQMTTQ